MKVTRAQIEQLAYNLDAVLADGPITWPGQYSSEMGRNLTTDQVQIVAPLGSIGNGSDLAGLGLEMVEVFGDDARSLITRHLWVTPEWNSYYVTLHNVTVADA